MQINGIPEMIVKNLLVFICFIKNASTLSCYHIDMWVAEQSPDVGRCMRCVAVVTRVQVRLTYIRSLLC